MSRGHDDRLDIRFAESVTVRHVGFDFVIDFEPLGKPVGERRTTIVLGPMAAKLLARELRRSLFRWEHFVGPIPTDDGASGQLVNDGARTDDDGGAVVLDGWAPE